MFNKNKKKKNYEEKVDSTQELPNLSSLCSENNNSQKDPLMDKLSVLLDDTIPLPLCNSDSETTSEKSESVCNNIESECINENNKNNYIQKTSERKDDFLNVDAWFEQMTYNKSHPASHICPASSMVISPEEVYDEQEVVKDISRDINDVIDKNESSVLSNVDVENVEKNQENPVKPDSLITMSENYKVNDDKIINEKENEDENSNEEYEDDEEDEDDELNIRESLQTFSKNLKNGFSTFYIKHFSHSKKAMEMRRKAKIEKEIRNNTPEYPNCPSKNQRRRNLMDKFWFITGRPCPIQVTKRYERHRKILIQFLQKIALFILALHELYLSHRENKGKPTVRGKHLASSHPRIAKEWSPRNGDKYTPYDFSANSKRLVWWTCKKCNYSYQETIFNRTHKNKNCPVCLAKRRREAEEKQYEVNYKQVRYSA